MPAVVAVEVAVGLASMEALALDQEAAPALDPRITLGIHTDTTMVGQVLTRREVAGEAEVAGLLLVGSGLAVGLDLGVALPLLEAMTGHTAVVLHPQVAKAVVEEAEVVLVGAPAQGQEAALVLAPPPPPAHGTVMEVPAPMEVVVAVVAAAVVEEVL